MKTDDELRDAFAMAALPALNAAYRHTPFRDIAEGAYNYADAMMAERAKRVPAKAEPSDAYRWLADAVRDWIAEGGDIRGSGYELVCDALEAIEAKERT